MKKSILKRCFSVMIAILLTFGCTVAAMPQEVRSAEKDLQIDLMDPALLATYGDIEIWGEKSYKFILPCDRILQYQFEVRNTGSENKHVRIDSDDSRISTNSYIMSHISQMMLQPQPNWMELAPGETNTAQISIDTRDFRSLKNKSNISVKVAMDITVKDVDTNGNESENGDKHSLTLASTVTTYSNKAVTSGSKCKVTICGYVKDSNGKAISNANVQVSSGWALHNSVFTDSKGYYSIKVMPYYSAYRKMYSEYALTTRVNGYKNRTYIVYPKKKTIKKNFKLKKQTSKLKYKQTKKMDIHIQAYDLDASDDGNVIATVPFHTLLPTSQTDGKRQLTVVTKTGKVLFTKDLPSETPYVDVSDDGQYIVVTSAFAGDNAYNAIIYDKSGNEVYRTPDMMPELNPYTLLPERDNNVQLYCARLSADNKTLVVGSTIGGLWVIDWQSGSIIWQTDIKGQLRTIDYSPDGNRLYVTGGGGYAYCFNAKTGKKLWQTFIQSWGTESTITDKYYIVTVKSTGYSLIVMDAKTGKKVWDYPTTCRGTCVSVSPDGKKLFWSTDNGGEYTPLNAVTFDIATGKILCAYAINNKYQGMIGKWSSDGKRICIKDGSGFGIYNSSTGEAFYEKNVLNRDGDSLSFSLYASDDLKYIVAGYNDDDSFRFWGQLYFFKAQ